MLVREIKLNGYDDDRRRLKGNENGLERQSVLSPDIYSNTWRLLLIHELLHQLNWFLVPLIGHHGSHGGMIKDDGYYNLVLDHSAMATELSVAGSTGAL